MELTAWDMSDFQYPSTRANFLPSSGICAMMSSELKMGSRYSQVAWHFSQASRISCMRSSFSSHFCRVSILNPNHSPATPPRTGASGRTRGVTHSFPRRPHSLVSALYVPVPVLGNVDTVTSETSESLPSWSLRSDRVMTILLILLG